MKALTLALTLVLMLLAPGSAFSSTLCIFKNLTGRQDHLAEFERCTLEAAQENNISPGIIVALKRTESSLRVAPDTINNNTDGSTDIGVMQINYPLWKHELWRMKKIELHRSDLKDICNSVHIAAYIVRWHLNRHGSLVEAVGWYHSGTPELKESYQDRFMTQAEQVIKQCQ